MFPADELYGEWTNEWVNPFRGKKVDMPDSCVIDCSTFVLPMDSMTRVTSKYGPRRRRMHKGIDLKVQIGDTIRAAFDGKVRIKNFERRGYGYYLVIRHPNGLETVYGHLSKFLVGVNDIVRAGDPIALGEIQDALRDLICILRLVFLDRLLTRLILLTSRTQYLIRTICVS